MRRFTIGDIHGNLKALNAVLDSANFDNDNDMLIVLGDISDGHTEVFGCVERLLQIKNLTLILGNHDLWLISWLRGDFDPVFGHEMVLDGDRKHYVKIIKNYCKRNQGTELNYWFNQGGRNTLKSYEGKTEEDMKRHLDFFNKGNFRYILDNMAFVHGGLPIAIEDLRRFSPQDFVWDRDLFYNTFSDFPKFKKNMYDKVFIGHTTTQIIRNCTYPMIRNKIYAMDTGAGYNGKLSMVNIDNDIIYQSSLAKEYYVIKGVR